jgi:hypothetical protein
MPQHPTVEYSTQTRGMRVTASRQRWPLAGTCVGAVVGLGANVLFVIIAFTPFRGPGEPWFLAPVTFLAISSSRHLLDSVAGFGRPFAIIVFVFVMAGPFFEWLFWGALVDVVRRQIWRRRTAA